MTAPRASLLFGLVELDDRNAQHDQPKHCDDGYLRDG
jgi:hypothetical protein